MASFKNSSNLYGINPVREALLANRRLLESVWVKNNPSQKLSEIIDVAKKANIKVRFAEEKELERLCKSEDHQGVVMFCGNLPKYDLKNWSSLKNQESCKIIACENISDPRNFGAIIRSAKFFGFDAVLKLAHNSCPLTATVSKTSAGALEIIDIIEENNLNYSLEALKKQNFWIYGADMEGENVYLEKPPKRFVLILGSEDKGMRRLTTKNCDQILAIPGMDNFESLNVSVAGAVLMSHLIKNSPA